MGKSEYKFEGSVISDLVEVLSCGSHLLPCFIKQLDTDAEELLPRSVMSEEHGVIVVAALVCQAKKTISDVKTWVWAYAALIRYLKRTQIRV